ncbi:MAG TPA: HAD-IA family hydrolase [Vicinamibacterales bacterium]
MDAAHDRPARGYEAVLFDLDGVVTRTADVHAAAWKALFDDFLREHARREGKPFQPFEHGDYLAFVDGKPRYEGVRGFLASRGIVLPDGAPDDEPGAWTVHGLGLRKDVLFLERLRDEGVEVFGEAVALIKTLRAAGVKTAVVTSSRNGREVLHVAGLEPLFDVRLDGLDAAVLHLRGKPFPDPFLKAAELLGVAPARAIVVEDSLPGVESARRGGFGLVVGLDHGGTADALADHGADLVVGSLGGLDVDRLAQAVATRRAARRAARLAWQVEQEGFDPAREHAMESLFAVGNGYLGVRGSPDRPLPGSQGDLFVAGIYDRKHLPRPYSEQEFLGDGRDDNLYSELVSMPFPFRVSVEVDGCVLEVGGPHMRQYQRRLDLRRAELHGAVSFDVGAGRRVEIRTRRCASQADLHLVLQEVRVCLANHSGELAVDFSLADPELAARHPHLTAAGVEEIDGVEVHVFRTLASGFVIALASRAMRIGEDRAAVRWRGSASIGETRRFLRCTAIYTSRDTDDPRKAAVDHVRAIGPEAIDAAFREHAERWAGIWDAADIRIPGSPATEQALRFNACHLTSAADRDPRISVGGRALTGRAYEGHIFWDVEMFKLPFYLYTAPDVARCLLLYRHHTLDGARRRAREFGNRGAFYAWESTVTGDDVTPRAIRLKTTGKVIPIFTGTQQIHITADVAHAVWRYWEATRDEVFLRDVGLEILIETARYWASRVVRGPRGWHIRGVVGPDEYHHGVDDNAYTNWMARDNVEKAIEALRWAESRYARERAALAERLRLEPAEVEQWSDVTAELYCPGPDARGVIEQFEGFFDLPRYPLPAEERFRAPISRLFEWDEINRLQVIKQADVLMLLHVFPDAFPRDIVEANYRYYEPLTDHGSSLSPGIHAAIAARLGLREDAERYWRESLWLDLSNSMSNSALGIHPACMGATWQALVFGFLGVRFDEEGPVVDPDAAARLPEDWHGVSTTLAWRGRRHRVHAGREVAP